MAGMVDINELYITPDNKKIILDISVKKKKYYKDVYLDEIKIDTQDTFIQDIGCPSNEYIAKRKIVGEDYIAKVAWETGKVDEYMDLMCTLKHCKCHNHCDCGCDCHHEPHHHKPHLKDHCQDCDSHYWNYHNHYNNCDCGCEHDCNNHCHCDTCHCRTGETGHYANPFSVKAIDLVNKLAVGLNDIKFPLCEGAFYKFVIKEEEQQQEETEQQEQEEQEENVSDNNINTEEQNINEDDNLTIKDNGDIYMYNGKDLTLYLKDTIPLNVKHARIEILQEDIKRPFSDTMFFIWIKTKGIPTPDCPCGTDEEWTLGVCVSMYTIYRRFMCLMRELLKDCEIPKYFIDLYLRWQAVKMCIENGHYTEAILYWKRFFLFKHQRPLYEQPQYIKYWEDIHNDILLPQTNYEHPSYGFGGNLFIGGCRKCGR